MRYEVKYDADNDCVMCRMFGKVQSSDVPDFISESSVLHRKHHCDRNLTDLREVDLQLSIVELYDIPKFVAEEGFRGAVKRAIVFSKDAENSQFFEDASVNRGQNLKVFTDFDEALTWLKGHSFH